MPQNDLLISRRHLVVALVAGSVSLCGQQTAAPAANSALSDHQKEAFMLTAKLVRTRPAPSGITGTVRATLDDGQMEHEASIQTIDQSKQQFETPKEVELMFRDCWKFNLAAYKLDRVLGLNMVPTTVERKYKGTLGSYTWWVKDVLMNENERIRAKKESPDPDAWNKQMHIVRVFDQLIRNSDRNGGNIVIDKDWRIWMIDHSRAFRLRTDLRDPKSLEMCDTDLLASLKQLTRESLQAEIGAYVGSREIEALLVRRDKIVAIFESKGPSALYTALRRPS